jgi:hypothetical protein
MRSYPCSQNYSSKMLDGPLIFFQVSNICDEPYLGYKATISTFAPFLRSKTQNRKATMLLLFQNLVWSLEMECGPEYAKADMSKRSRWVASHLCEDEAEDLFTQNPARNPFKDPELGRHYCLPAALDDYDSLFKKFVETSQINELAKAYGVGMKKSHSLVEKWPYRITYATSKKDVEILLLMDVCGKERYVEFERTG